MGHTSFMSISQARRIASFFLTAMATPLSLLAASSTSSPNSPTFSPGFLVAYWVCNSRKRNPIGGWLLFFYWQLYSGLVISGVLFASNIQSYVPENFDDHGLYLMFLASTLPALLLFGIKCAIGTLLLSARTWDVLQLLRWVMIAELACEGVGAVIDGFYFPDNLGLGFLSIVPNLLWLVYFFRSDRVRHIFLLNDWDTAVNYIHPLKLKMATYR